MKGQCDMFEARCTVWSIDRCSKSIVAPASQWSFSKRLKQVWRSGHGGYFRAFPRDTKIQRSAKKPHGEAWADYVQCHHHYHYRAAELEIGIRHVANSPRILTPFTQKAHERFRTGVTRRLLSLER